MPGRAGRADPATGLGAPLCAGSALPADAAAAARAGVTWQGVRAAVLARIAGGEWLPGARIPDEADLAAAFGCARATVNRALRDLAAAGLLERRRRGGTRVAAVPVRRAVLTIPIIRADVEARGMVHGYRLLSDAPGEEAGVGPVRRVRALHLADGAPWCLEDRWINPAAVPGLAAADFGAVSANEWLVRNVPVSDGAIAFGAVAADAETAALLACAVGAALLTVERQTRTGGRVVTGVRLTYAHGHRVTTAL
jgi:GntR family histidine utilization transcriptional repressor